ncbi:MAG: hypothetical protein JXQ99_18915 [Hyphomicrobiaceae bacterium]
MLFGAIGLLFGAAQAATRTTPQKDHRWQLVTLNGLPTAIAARCADCLPDIELRCLTRGRGLMELSIPGAAVANGRAGASKQIRLSLGAHSARRRALTRRHSRGFVPVLQLAVDDALLDLVQGESVLKINFYGQRSFVGLRGAARPVEQVRAACLPTAAPMSKRHCTWAVVVECFARRERAVVAAKALPGAFAKARAGRFCVIVTSAHLASAQARAAAFGGYVERSCLP